jgi:NAD(P)-dependent dehydrogenase (short-subunit alcohol dehydrogenase family)
VVSGASSGIGAAVVTRLLDDGWDVVGLSRRRPEGSPSRLTWLPIDLADTGALADTIDSHRARIGRVDAVVHAAGLQYSAPVGDLDPEHSTQMWRVHVAAAEALVNGLAPDMDDGARIVLVGSRTMTGSAGKSQYAATKSALVGLARSWAAELVARRITVNVVAPGPTDTPMLADPNRAGTPPAMPPMGRLIDPAEVAGTVAFLLGPDACSITGQVITQCAGMSL